MKLIIIGSSSQGNSYAIQSDSGEILLIEAVVPLKEVKKAIGYKTSKVVGCIISHWCMSKKYPASLQQNRIFKGSL